MIDKAESAFQSRVTQKTIFLVFTKEKERLVREWLSSLLYHLYSGKYWEGGKKRFPLVRQHAQFHLWDVSFIGNWLWVVENFVLLHPSRFLIQHFFLSGVVCVFWEKVWGVPFGLFLLLFFKTLTASGAAMKVKQLPIFPFLLPLLYCRVLFYFLSSCLSICLSKLKLPFFHAQRVVEQLGQ